MNTRHQRISLWAPKALAALAVAVGLSACEETGKPAKHYGELRLDNQSDATMTLWVGADLAITAPPGKERSARAPEGLIEVSIRTEAGEIRFKQYADVPDNIYARYIVKSDGSIVLTGGNISLPYDVGSRKEQVQLENDADYAVELLINGQLLGAVAPYFYARFNVPHEVLELVFRQQGGPVLFSQIVDIPRNGFFSYKVLRNGIVTVTGGEVVPNTQQDPHIYYYRGY